LRNHGQTKQYEADYLGYNSRLDAIQAAVLLAKLKYLDRFNKLRQDIAHKYNRGFANLKGLSVPVELEDSFCVYHLYTIKVSQNRDGLLRYLNSKGIGARVYYPKLISQMKAFRGLKIKGSLKNAKSIPGKVLSLPIHPFLTEQQVQKVIKTVLSFFKK
jgi:dTDP-4-amino-4,6-dideoxygalactose transaminase